MVWSSNCWFGALTINVTGNGSISFAQTVFLYFFGRKNWWIFDQIRFQTMNFSIFLSVVCVSRAKNQFYNVFFFPSLTKLIHIRLLDILKCNEKKNFWIFYSYFDSFQFSSIKVDNRREKKNANQVYTNFTFCSIIVSKPNKKTFNKFNSIGKISRRLCCVVSLLVKYFLKMKFAQQMYEWKPLNWNYYWICVFARRKFPWFFVVQYANALIICTTVIGRNTVLVFHFISFYSIRAVPCVRRRRSRHTFRLHYQCFWWCEKVTTICLTLAHCTHVPALQLLSH